MGNMKQH